MKNVRFLGIIILVFSFSHCTTTKQSASGQKTSSSNLLPPTSIKNGDIRNYKYVYITPTNILTSISGYTTEGYFYTSGNHVYPSDILGGKLAKEGFIRLPELKPELAEKTLIVNYGESGRRNTGLFGYTIEVTIQFISSKSSELICSCTAEGQGQTEADDIRIAVTRCLAELMPKAN